MLENIKITNINMEILIEQKAALTRIVLSDELPSKEDREILSGLLNMLDAPCDEHLNKKEGGTINGLLTDIINC